MDNESASQAIEPISSPETGRKKDNALLAKLVLRDGKPFHWSALQAGYSTSAARRGLKWTLEHSPQFAAAYKQESSLSLITAERLKPLVMRALHDELSNPRSSQRMKAVELTGRLKELDMWVRNIDTAVGVFVALGERKEAITQQADVIEQYQD